LHVFLLGKKQVLVEVVASWMNHAEVGFANHKPLENSFQVISIKYNSAVYIQVVLN